MSLWDLTIYPSGTPNRIDVYIQKINLLVEWTVHIYLIKLQLYKEKNKSQKGNKTGVMIVKELMWS